MIGGSIYIKIRGVDNEKLSLTTTPSTMKAGTYDKIKRALSLQKKVVLMDLIVGGFPVTADCYPMIQTSYTPLRVTLRLEYAKTTDGSISNTYITISEDDKIRLSSNIA